MKQFVDLIKVVEYFLKLHSFKKQGRRWALVKDDCITSFHFVKDRHTDIIYLRLGFWFPGLEVFPPRIPHEGAFHIGADIGLLVEAAKELELQFQLIDTNGYFATPEERLGATQKIGGGIFASLLNDWTTLDAIKKNYFQEKLLGAQINWEVRDYFGDMDWRKNAVIPSGEIKIITPDDI